MYCFNIINSVVIYNIIDVECVNNLYIANTIALSCMSVYIYIIYILCAAQLLIYNSAWPGLHACLVCIIRINKLQDRRQYAYENLINYKNNIYKKYHYTGQ